MLRTLQTKALSDKIATLFDALVPVSNMTAQPIPIQASQPYDKRAQYAQLCNKPPRRRRTRSHRRVSAPAALKTSWY